tara:strand:- start:1057 stop:1434 length:378 start_codon:yes stop_codon:yes gene_type:complete
MAANTNKPMSSVPGNRREFSRRDSSLTASVSLTQEFSESWEAKIADISLVGMRLVGKLPQIDDGPLYVRLEGTEITINGDFISQGEGGLRIKMDLDDLQLAELVAHSDVYASLVLETISDDFPPR